VNEKFPIDIGAKTSFSKTVSESDVYGFAGITGDFAPNHVDEEYMRKSGYGSRIAHGALLVGYMSTASSKILEIHARKTLNETVVSLGYDRVRFLGAVYFGDTITVNYEITEIDQERRRSSGAIEVVNQKGDVVAIATHILKWVPNTE
jgi:3-hydroxybutyryl-CoA dehydratase